MKTANFDLIARPYRWLELLTFGSALHRARTASLPQITQDKELRHALVLGDGDGRFTYDLLQAHPQVQVEAVDGSAVMLSLLEQRCARLGDRLRTTHADARLFQPDGIHDLVVSHFFLDCFTTEEVEGIIQKVSPALRDGGVWVVSDFHIPPVGAMQWISRQVVRSLYLSFRILAGLRTTALPDYASAMRRHGFRRTWVRQSLGGLLVSEIWSMEQT